MISAKYPPLIDPSRTTLAFGNRALPRLDRELRADVLLTRQRALMSLCDYLHDPEHIAGALRQGIVESLVCLLSDEDMTCRLKSAECLQVIASHAIGRQAFLTHKVIQPLSTLFDDSEDIVRKNSHLALEMASRSVIVSEGIIEAKLVPILVAKVKTELDEIKMIILDALHFCFKVHVQDALDNQAMVIFADCLKHESAVIRYKAARNIMDLCVVLEGKNQAVEVKCMDSLVHLLKDTNTDVRANAAGAIMSITITTKGKYTALEAGALQPLLELTEDGNSEVRVNSLKALTSLSEAPEGRKALLEEVERIKKRLSDPIPAIVRAAEIALKTILWKP